VSNGEGGGGFGAGLGAVVGSAVRIARNIEERREQRRQRDREEEQRAASAAYLTATRAIQAESEQQRPREQARLFPLPSVVQIASGERVSPTGQVVGGTGGRAPTTGNPIIDALLAILQILLDRFRRTGPASVVIPEWVIVQAQRHGIPIPGELAGARVGGGTTMPNLPANIGDFTGSGPGFDFGDIIGPNSWACRTLGFGCGSQPTPTFPGGTFPQPFPHPQEGFPPMFANGGAAQGAIIPGTGCATSPFRSGAQATARASLFCLPNPLSGKPVWFLPAGRPLLFSGDVSAMRRVRRVASMAGRASGRRTRRRRGGR